VLHRGFSLITLIGLSIGIAMGLLVLIYVNFEVGYDRYLPASERTYRLYSHGLIGDDEIQSALTPIPLYDIIREQPEVEYTTRLVPGIAKMIETAHGKSLEQRFYYADNSFFNVFEFDFVYGDVDSSLRNSNSVVITETTSRRLFGDKNSVGELISLENGLEFIVSGILADVPSNTHFSFDFIANWEKVAQNILENNEEQYPDMFENWLYLNSYTYVRMRKEVDYANFSDFIGIESSSRIESQIYKTFGDENPYPENIRLNFDLQSIHDIHLNSKLDNELQKGVNPLYVFVFGGIAFIILLVTAINFMNLTTAKASNRFKEIAVRKVFSARRGDLIFQFLTESIVYSFLALFVALVMVELFLPTFNRLFDIGMNTGHILGSFNMFWVLFITLMVGVLSGSYPAVFFSGLKGFPDMKGNVRVGKAGLVIRGILVSVQISIAFFLLTITFGLYGQLQFLRSSSHGFKPSNVVVFDRGTSVSSALDTLIHNLQGSPGVDEIGVARYVPGEDFNIFSFKGTTDSSQVLLLGVNYVDAGFFPVMNAQLLSGRLFEASDTNDMSKVVINKTAAKILGYNEGSGSTVELIGGRSSSEIYVFHIIGVVEDVYFESMRHPVRPMVFIQQPASQRSGSVLIRYRESFNSDDLLHIMNLWEKHFGDQPLNYFSLSERLNSFYFEEHRFVRIAAVFSILAFVLALLGQIGMAAFVVNYHRRNMEIKRVLAASYPRLLIDTFGGFAFFIFFGVACAVPAAYTALSLWLSGFQNNTGIAVVWFLTPALLIAGSLFLIVWVVGMREIKEK
jgi:putative ABC transport system permease protein